jgi:hypothetical protein
MLRTDLALSCSTIENNIYYNISHVRKLYLEWNYILSTGYLK